MQLPNDIVSAVQAMKKQLRQDFLHMLLNQALPDGFSMAELNQRYQYTFSEGAYCIFCVREAALGIENQQERISQAAKQALSYVSSDYELITWNGLVFCICGADERDALLSTVYALFEHLTAENPGVWTMGVGKVVPSTLQINDSLVSAQHAYKYSVVHGNGRIYDANQQNIIYGGSITLLTPAEQLFIKKAFHTQTAAVMTAAISDLFQIKLPQIQRYPVFAYMLSLQILTELLQLLRQVMPIDRKTYEVYAYYEHRVDDNYTLDALKSYTEAGAVQMMERYSAYLQYDKSKPIWIVTSYLQEHFTKKVTLEQLATLVDRNPQYLSSIFKKECGVTVTEYISTLRINQAKRLLRGSNLPINEISRQVGYENPAYFSKCFFRQVGRSPQQYRVK